MREALTQPLHGALGPYWIGERHLEPVILEPGPLGRRQKVGQVPADPGDRTWHGGGHELGAGEPVRADVDQPGPLDVPLLGERVGDRRAGVAHGPAHALAAVQVAEGDVVGALEGADRHVRDAAHADVALAVAARAAGDERVGQDDRPRAPSGQVAADEGHGVLDRRRVAALRELPGGADDLRLKIGDAVEGDVADHDRLAHADGVGAQVHPRRVDQVGAEAEPAGGVVVAADHHRADPLGDQPPQRLVAQRHRVDRGKGAIVDVTGDDHHVDALRADRLHEVVDEGALGVDQALTVEGPAQVPVGGVQHTHVAGS